MREYLTYRQLKTYSFQKIQRLQNLRFKATCKHLLPLVPFYQKLFSAYGVNPSSLRTVEDWKSHGLPLIKKSAYLKNPQDFIVTPDPKTLFSTHLSYLFSQDEYKSAFELLLSQHKKELLTEYYSPKMLVFSGGTTGAPSPMLLTATQKFDTLMAILKIAGEVILERFPEEKKIGMNLFPYAPHLGWHAVHHALDINADLNLCTAAGGAVPTERLVALADKAKPNIICGMSEYIRNRFLPLAAQKKITLPERVLFVNGAQKMHEAERQKIAELARKVGVKEAIVLDLYGASELKEALMPECAQGTGFHHIAPLSTIVRTVTARHTKADLIDDWDFVEGGGYAASWNIDGAGSLLHGYFIADHFERIVNETCPTCKLNVMRIHNINRIQDVEAQLALTGVVEEKVKGSRVNLAAYRETALSVAEVSEAQVVLKRKQKLVEVRFVSEKPNIALAKLKSAYAGEEIKPKLVPVTLARLQGEKLKLEAIKIEP